MQPILLSKPTKTRKGWRITSDPHGYTLEVGAYVTDRETKEDKLQWRNRSYYGSISQALRGFQETFLRETTRKLPDAIDETIKIIRPLLKEIDEHLTVTL